MKRNIQSPQRHMRVLAIKLTGTGTAALGEGSHDATLTDNGTGDYTLTFTNPFSRAPIVQASSETAVVQIKIHASSTTSCQIKTFAMDGTTAKDAVLHVLIMGADVADQN